jgi:hypothetical protein
MSFCFPRLKLVTDHMYNGYLKYPSQIIICGNERFWCFSSEFLNDSERFLLDLLQEWKNDSKLSPAPRPSLNCPLRPKSHLPPSSYSFVSPLQPEILPPWQPSRPPL